MRKPTIAISPISTGDLTEGKEYEIFNYNETGLTSFTIVDNEGNICLCLEKECAQIEYLNWELK